MRYEENVEKETMRKETKRKLKAWAGEGGQSNAQGLKVNVNIRRKFT
jgi:hypothetical protein